jgi:hypothetical protein
MLIQNYGLFWQRSRVFFGTGGGGNAGHLKGVPAYAKTSDPVDFRDQQGVYCLYDDNFRLVYVGQAGGKNDQRLFVRLKQHRTDNVADRWTRFSWFGIREVLGSGNLKAVKGNSYTKISDVLNHIEGILIAAAEPIHNRQGGRFGEHVEQYIQYRDDDNLGPESSEMIKQIWESLPENQ